MIIHYIYITKNSVMRKCLSFLIIAYCFIISCNDSNNGSSSEASVIVDLTYPSEYLPEMDVYLFNTQTKQSFKLRSAMNVSPVIFENVPSGRYVVYAITVEKLEQAIGDDGIELNEAVSAVGGFTANYDDWILLQFEVDGSDVKVEINDWDVNIPQ